MDRTDEDAVREVSDASDAERISFPEVIARLVAAGVERYHVDLVRAERVYYHPDGAAVALPVHSVGRPVAAAFSASGIETAVRASQRGEMRYREFCRRAVDAGCVGYLVSLVGRRVVYYGRTGETHVEHFPPAKQ